MPAKRTRSLPDPAAQLAANLGRRHSAYVIAYHQAVADQLAMSASDLKCLDLIRLKDGQMTATELAKGTGLTHGAMTFVIDRLEQAGYVRRQRDPQDRRRWTLHLNSDTNREGQADQLYQPFANDMLNLLQRYSPSELELIAGFVGTVDELLMRHTSELRDRTDKPSK